ncbi:phage baseplate plug family protein [Bombella saccharophila]|uniref:Cyanophage baseplate Pam3 plug gp18 domain-containing protein n=1 Tax=Bombella saccharophila TaxID=2967338 RepID=A0ABT3W9K9_9PROT|nr:hypothetical protein [Bombella saccharophila]MCX5614444.1 hypothetical protein [Bombella saccharophila]
MAIIPLNASPSQEITTTLSGAPCRIWLRQLSTGMYLDLWLNEQPLIMGAVCLTSVDLIRNPTSPLSGKLFFTDTQGNDDPYYTGVGNRFFLQYEVS